MSDASSAVCIIHSPECAALEYCCHLLLQMLQESCCFSGLSPLSSSLLKMSMIFVDSVNLCSFVNWRCQSFLPMKCTFSSLPAVAAFLAHCAEQRSDDMQREKEVCVTAAERRAPLLSANHRVVNNTPRSAGGSAADLWSRG